MVWIREKKTSLGVCADPVKLWPCTVMAYMVMALYRHGSIQLWPYIGMALYSYGLYRYGSIYLWPYIGMTLGSYGPI